VLDLAAAADVDEGQPRYFVAQRAALLERLRIVHVVLIVVACTPWDGLKPAPTF